MPEKRLDETDRRIINHLQGGFPLHARPYAVAAGELGLEEEELLARLEGLLERGLLTRFGPMYDAAAMGGAFCLCAMAVPPGRFDEVAEMVGAHEEVAHNYEREHELNMWFVLATASPQAIEETARRIEEETGLEVLLFPKEKEYYIGLKMDL
jgi:DNA-binding Lrp family transcriptional regulator